MPEITESLQLNSKLCHTIYRYSDVGSTNNLARKFIEEDKKYGFCILAKTQTAGQGSSGRFWESPSGGLWSSLAIQPQINLHQLGIVPILSSIGIAKALETFNIETMLKWPNDLLIQRNWKKIGGILVEGKTTQFNLHYLIIGFGININNSIDQYSAELRNKITSTLEETNMELDLIKLLKKIIFHIEKRFDIIKSKGVMPIIDEWKNHPNILGMDIVVTNRDGVFRGKAIDISSFGQLILKSYNDEKITISTGTVSFLENND
jgi:BirA family biotin operon repressor/biotin-[acetyl-CoA-carboxylase] ligase